MNLGPAKLLLDQGLPRSSASLLRAIGWDVQHVGEIGMSSALDEEIVQFARDHGCIVVTLDADFHAIVATSGASTPSVLRLRVQGLAGQEMARLIKTIVDMCSADLLRGAIVSADSARVRIRRLPIDQ